LSRTAFPPGYAPFTAAQMSSLLKTLAWDDGNRRPTFARVLTPDQEERISGLFATQGGYIAPFPESNLQRAVAIAGNSPPTAPYSLRPPPPRPSDVPLPALPK